MTKYLISYRFPTNDPAKPIRTVKRTITAENKHKATSEVLNGLSRKEWGELLGPPVVSERAANTRKAN